jgi:8-oxo-dGTP pyrophosphatase MutT (NUDIX family)
LIGGPVAELIWPLPPAMAERAARFAAEGGVPPEPRVAATVVLLRPARGEQRPFEVYAIRRTAGMVFGGMYAFPGGGVDPSDSEASVGWAGPPPSWWADRLRLPEGRARAVVCAAVREVFEEAGVLLAGPDPRALVADAGDPRWEAARRALVARERSLTDFLAEAGLSLRSDLLVPWSRWITPEFEPRRFDTYFFLALLPEGQLTRDVSGEADHTLWIRPAEAVRRYAAGEFPMLPPTVVTMRDLTRHDDVATLLAAAAERDAATPVSPRVIVDSDGGARLVLA